MRTARSQTRSARPDARPSRGPRRRLRVGLIAIWSAVACLAASASASAAPFADGSFETPVVPPGTFTDIAAPGTIGPWTVTAGSVDLIGAGIWQAADGVQSVDLDGVNAGTLCQTYDSNSPGNGAMTFQLSRNFSGTPSATVQVTANGAVVGTFTHNAPATLANMMYQSHTVTFPVTGPTTTLCFQSLTPGAFGPVIDAVALSATDLGITKTAAPTTVLHGQNVVYTLTVTNNGPNPATAPTITDTLPAGQSLVFADAACTTAGTPVVVTCPTPDLPSGSSVTIHLTASTGGIPAPLTGPLGQTNTASVASTTTDTNPANNTATANIIVVPAADLSLVKTASPDPVIANQQVTYTLTATNAGPDTAVNAKVVDTLPAGVTFVNEGTPPPGTPSCAVTGGTPAVGQVVTCTLGDIPAGGTATATIVAVVTGTPPPASVQNTATVSSDTADPNLVNNTSVITTGVTPNCTITITGRHIGAIDVQAGQFLCLTNATQTGAILVDTGGALTATNSTILGGVQSNGAVFMTLCGNTFNGSGAIVIKNTTLLTRVGDDAIGCAGNNITGSVTLTANKGGVEVFGNTIRGSLAVDGNLGASAFSDGTPEVEGNTVGGALGCTANNPAPINEGSVNTVTGAKLGQCQTL